MKRVFKKQVYLVFVSCDHVVCFSVISPLCIPTRSIGFDVKADYLVKDSTFRNSIDSYFQLVSLSPISVSKFTQSEKVSILQSERMAAFHKLSARLLSGEMVNMGR